MQRKLVAASAGALALMLMAFVGQLDSFFVYMPVIMRQPTPTPTNTPTPTVTPTATTGPTLIPCPAATPAPVQMFTASGVRGVYFRMQNNRNCFNVGEDAWFEFKAINDNPTTLVDVGGLGAYWSNGAQTSWGDFDFRPGDGDNAIEWNDHINIYTPGTYQVRLGICFLSSRPDCENNAKSGGSAWQALSSSITIVIR